MAEDNPMREIRIEKVTLNVGAGGPGEELEKSKALLKELTGMEPKETEARSRSAFGVSKGRSMGTKVTLRGKEAREFLERVFEANPELSKESFDGNGNFSVGIEEHIDLPGTEYDPEMGILGLDVTVTLERPGFRVRRKKISKKIGKGHRISKQEAMEFVDENFDVNIVGG
jgi:large subunit ribosomal protein L5